MRQGSWLDRWRFSLRELFAVILLMAGGLMGVRAQSSSWPSAGLMVASIALAIGLCQQARDIARCLRNETNLPEDIRSAWRAAVVWRWGVAVLIVDYWASVYARITRWFQLEDYLYDSTRIGIFLLSLVLALFATPWWVPRPRDPSVGRRVALVAMLPVAAMILVLVLRDAIVIQRLVYRAIQTIVSGILPPVSREQKLAFVVVAAVASALTACGVWLILRQAARSAKGRPTVFTVTAVCLCLLAGMVHTVWVHTGGLAGVSPCMAEGVLCRPWHGWLSAGALLLLLSGILTYRLSLTSRGADDTPNLMWRRTDGNYWNERPFFHILLVLAGIGSVLGSIELADLRWPCTGLFYTCIWPSNLGMIGLVCMSAWAFFQRGNREGERALQTCMPLRASPLVATWLALALAIACAVEAITWLAYGISILD